MAAPHRVYRALIHLYPADFRRHYSQDLVQHFDDLVSDRGIRAAWARTGLDLTVTVPRYQLERIMTEQQTSTALYATVALLTLGGVATLTIDNQIGIVLLVAGLVLGLTQRSALATSFRVPDSSLRRKRLRTAAVLGGIFVLSYGAFVLTVGDSWTITDTLLALIGTPAMIGAPLFLLAGLLTPRRPDGEDLARAR
jgi:peptidoglycan/LPS O-acetylase OafA/YrhL